MSASATDLQRKRAELRAFGFLTVVLFPLLAVAIVAGYGFVVWIWQIYNGPPGAH